MTKERYSPRNRNENVTRERLSWSAAFDEHIARNRPSEPCGFKLRGDKS